METVKQDDPTRASAHYIGVVADIVSAFVSNNSMRPQELPELIASVHASIAGIENGSTVEQEIAKREPAVSIKKSLGDGSYLISLIDGKKYKTLRRHIGTHGFTPDDYRREFGLANDYPMVAPQYSATRSTLAKKIGLGSKTSESLSPMKHASKEGSKSRGRPPKAA